MAHCTRAFVTQRSKPKLILEEICSWTWARSREPCLLEEAPASCWFPWLIIEELLLLLLSKHRLQKGFPSSTHLSAGRSSPKAWTLDVTAKLGADVGPGTSSGPFQPPLFSDRPVVRWGDEVPLLEGLVCHTNDDSSSNDPEQCHKQEDKTQQRGKDVEMKLLDTYWFPTDSWKSFCHPTEPNERWQLPSCRHPLPLEHGTTGGRRALAAAEMDFTLTQLPSVPAVLPTIMAAETPNQTKTSVHHTV